MRGEPPDLENLRSLYRSINDALYGDVSDTLRPNVRVPLFYCALFIQELLFNLALDFRYDESTRPRLKTLCDHLASSLDELAEAWGDVENGATWIGLRHLAECYIAEVVWYNTKHRA